MSSSTLAPRRLRSSRIWTHLRSRPSRQLDRQASWTRRWPRSHRPPTLWLRRRRSSRRQTRVRAVQLRAHRHSSTHRRPLAPISQPGQMPKIRLPSRYTRGGSLALRRPQLLRPLRPTSPVRESSPGPCLGASPRSSLRVVGRTMERSQAWPTTRTTRTDPASTNQARARDSRVADSDSNRRRRQPQETPDSPRTLTGGQALSTPLPRRRSPPMRAHPHLTSAARPLRGEPLHQQSPCSHHRPTWPFWPKTSSSRRTRSSITMSRRLMPQVARLATPTQARRLPAASRAAEVTAHRKATT